LRIQTQPIHVFATGIATATEVRTLSERLIFVR